MRVHDFDFDLPPRFIAQRPMRPRDAARLLVAAAALADRRVADLPGLLAPGDVMVFNDTRVIAARLVGQRGAARIEATLHKREGVGRWRAFARPARRLKVGDGVDFAPGLAARVVEKREGGEVTLDFDMSDAALMASLERVGHMPLPPYIKREAAGDATDRDDYQTVYAQRPGAVAAPTAGLHFTPRLLAALDRRGIERVHVTLHVGAGTFLPVRSETVEGHRMHAEWGEIGRDAAARVNAARARGNKVIAVGTTSLRLLEAAARASGRLEPFAGETDIFIVPGFGFRVVDRLLTNFHLPRSTLFMLVAAFAGLERMKAAYAHAKANDYRFYSYGDACLLERAEG